MADTKSQRIMKTEVEATESTSSQRRSEKKSRREKSDRRERESVRLAEEPIHLEEPSVATTEVVEKKREKKRREKAAAVPVVESVETVQPAPVEKEKKVRAKSSKKEKVAPVVEQAVEVASTAAAESSSAVEEKVPFSVLDLTFSKRRVVEKEELDECFEQYARALENELEQSRQNKNRKVNVKTWRLFLNEIRRLKTISVKAMKKPKKRTENTQSGFMKPVQISQEMASFAGWSTKDTRSRVEVTKFICNYIKDNNLQNPSDRRQILVDDALSKLLNHPKNSETPLTYYLLQKKIQHHFVV